MGDQKTQEGHGASRDLAHAGSGALEGEAARLATIAHPMFRTYGYQGLFNSIADAVNREAVGIGISVRAFLLALIDQDNRGRPFAPSSTEPAAPSGDESDHDPAVLAEVYLAMRPRYEAADELISGLLAEVHRLRATAERQPSPRDADPLPQSKANKP